MGQNDLLKNIHEDEKKKNRVRNTSEYSNVLYLPCLSRASNNDVNLKTQIIVWHPKRSRVIHDEELQLLCSSADSDDSDYNPQFHKKIVAEDETNPDRSTIEKNCTDIEERMPRKTLVRRRKTNESFMTHSDSDSDNVDLNSCSLSPKYNESRVLQNETINDNLVEFNNKSSSFNGIKETLHHTKQIIQQSNVKLGSDANLSSRAVVEKSFNSPVNRIKHNGNINSENTLRSNTPNHLVESDYDNSIEFSPSSSLDSTTIHCEEKRSLRFCKISSTDFTPLPDRPVFGDQMEVHMCIEFPVFLNDDQVFKLLSHCGKIVAWRRNSNLTASPRTGTGVCNIKSVSSALRLIRVLDNFRINSFPISVTARQESQSTIKYFIKKLNSRFSEKGTLNGLFAKKEFNDWNCGSTNMNLLLTQGDLNCDITAVRNITKYLRENNFTYQYGFVKDKKISYSRLELLHLRSSSASSVLGEPILTSLSSIGINKENNRKFIVNQISCHRLMSDDVPQKSTNRKLSESQTVNEQSSNTLSIPSMEQVSTSAPINNTNGVFPFSIARFKIHPCKSTDCNKKEKCPYFHDFEDKRRDPFIHKYRPRLCTQSSSCIRGENCNFSHNAIERLYHPDFFRTKPCTRDPCKYGKSCAFLHKNYETEKPLLSSSQQLPDTSLRIAMTSTLGREDDNSSDSGFKSPSTSSLEKEMGDSPVQSSSRKDLNRDIIDTLQLSDNNLINNANGTTDVHCQDSVGKDDSNCLPVEHRKRAHEDDEIHFLTSSKRLKPNDVCPLDDFQSSSTPRDNTADKPNSICQSNIPAFNAKDSPCPQMDSNQNLCGGTNSGKEPVIVTLDSDDSDTPSDETEFNKNKKKRNTYSTDMIIDCFISLSKVESLLGACSSIVTSLLIKATIMNDKGEKTFKIFENKDNIYLLNIVYHKLLCQITPGQTPDHLKEILQETIEKVDEVLRLLQMPVKKESVHSININQLAKAMKGKKREQVVKFIEQTFCYRFNHNPSEHEIKKVWSNVAPKLYEMTIMEQESKSTAQKNNIISPNKKNPLSVENHGNPTNNCEALSTLLKIIPVLGKISDEPGKEMNQENDLIIRQSSDERISKNNTLKTSSSAISLESSYNLHKDKANEQLPSTSDSKMRLNANNENQSDSFPKSDAVYKNTLAQSTNAHSSYQDYPAPLTQPTSSHSSFRGNPAPLTSLFPGMAANIDLDERRLLLDFTPSPGKIPQTYYQGSTMPSIDSQTPTDIRISGGRDMSLPTQNNNTFTPSKAGERVDVSSNEDNHGNLSSPRNKYPGPSTSSDIPGDQIKVRKIIDGLRNSPSHQFLHDDSPQENRINQETHASPQDPKETSVPITSKVNIGAIHDSNNAAECEINAHELAYLLLKFNSYDRKTKFTICEIVKNTKNRFPAMYEQTFQIKEIWEKEGFQGHE
ncbi:unnamed protein product, partial [Meganyctiphanes norvegica]